MLLISHENMFRIELVFITWFLLQEPLLVLIPGGSPVKYDLPNFQVRANMMIKKKYVKRFCCYDQKQHPSIPTFFCFCCRNKNVVKMLPNNKEKFLFRKFSSKSLSNVSSDFGHRGGLILIQPMYLHHI